MTRDEQSTDRALSHAEAEWLRARDWKPAIAHGARIVRWTHPELEALQLISLTQSDALALTRAEPLRFRGRR